MTVRLPCDAFIERGPRANEACHFPARYRVLTTDELVCGHHARAWLARVLVPLAPADEARSVAVARADQGILT